MVGMVGPMPSGAGVIDLETARVIAEGAAPWVPVFLAGGLGPENVTEAIRTFRPFGIDLCSGVRTENRLDGAKLRAFMAAVRAAGTTVGTPSGTAAGGA